MSTIVFLSSALLILVMASAFFLGFVIRHISKGNKSASTGNANKSPSNPWSIM